MKLFAKIFFLLLVLFLIWVFLRESSWFSPKIVMDFSGEKNVIIDDEGLEIKIKTKANDVGAVLAENNITLGEKDEVIPARNTAILPEMKIFINRSARVKIQVDGETREMTTFAKTVEGALLESNIALGYADITNPAEQTRLRDGMEIVVTRVQTEEITEENPIEFEVIEEKDKELSWGEKKVAETGENGIRETAYKITYENGKEISRVKLASKITKKPTAKIVKIGTKINIGETDTGIASWYNADSMTCASRDYPPGRWLRVTNLANGRQVFVKVAGYGPQAGTGKLIDLDNAAFKKLAPLGQGTTRVKVEEILNKGFDPGE